MLCFVCDIINISLSLSIFGFHQNGSPEMLHRERVGGIRHTRNQSQRPSAPSLHKRNLKNGRGSRESHGLRVIQQVIHQLSTCFPVVVFVRACCYLLLSVAIEFQGGVHSSEASHAGNGQELRCKKAKTHWQKLADTVLQIDTQ